MTAKNIIVWLCAMIVSVFCSFSAIADENVPQSLEKMSDGGYFDPDFFQQMYPELIASIGTDPTINYQHYLRYGQCQGWKPFSDEVASKIQSLTYQPGNIVVPASVKSHPEGKHTLVYTDSNVDIFYQSISSAASSLNGTKKMGLCFDVVNKTSDTLHMYGDLLSINNQMRKNIFSVTSFPNSSSEKYCRTDYPDEEFDQIANATFQVKYKIGDDGYDYTPVKFNLIFYH
ncbi:MAG: hypothetical protein PUB12_04475 [[Clostridium] aminophilum]|uniref:hypothetical protein n=1 Tax=[Clostridium] aminophilum TaxID=1526 RepID=UPI0026EDF832|nr:hypothetical protein [[Clostridium] aminophilum]MDD6196124.1 hypothetical protein [[Clostridium] aminophilum]